MDAQNIIEPDEVVLKFLEILIFPILLNLDIISHLIHLFNDFSNICIESLLDFFIIRQNVDSCSCLFQLIFVFQLSFCL